MTRRAKIWRNIGIAAAAIIVALAITAIQVVQTDWFRGYVKAKIISAVADGTGGRVELGAVVKLAVSLFELDIGMVVFASQKQELSARGRNLSAQLFYNVLSQGYEGQLSFQPLYVVSGQNTPVTLTVTLPVGLQRDRVD